MALIDVALAQPDVVFVDTTTSPDFTDLDNAGVPTADTAVFYGNSGLNLSTVVGSNTLSNGYTVATGGADLIVDPSMLDLGTFTSTTLIIDGDSSITLNAGGVSLASVLSSLMNNAVFAFSGSGDGVLTYVPPNLGLLASTTINVEEMGAGDQIVIPIPGNGYVLEPNAYTLRESGSSWDGTHLTLMNGDFLNQIFVNIAMTPAEYALYSANKAAYLNADGADTFTFPGNDDADPDYEVPCFTRGTMITTPDGPRAVEDLGVGDKVTTQGGGIEEIRWIKSRALSKLDLLMHPKLGPIRIKAGALGENKPTQDLCVSRQHRMLVRSKITERMFHESEILVAAVHLLDMDGIEVADDFAEVEYFHILFDKHEVVIANGAETESLYLGPQAIKCVSKAARDEIFTLFPELRTTSDIIPDMARLMPKGHKARRLVERHIKNRRCLVE
ncbi:hypothetical protein FHS72_001550 [Loktanella ponticola]|uniref:Hedgehog/Intein (Hint) domain-containing protein n=1 Tax=Yoonia ponticola TaxID=1524255 RepID=A0A7W9BJZ8_9RHOB|nr:Hint domain-containing protein [Yoonia ponticola]MBB5721926.1 hypothetical protein [Yoonia ponticola]